jgi:membrane protease YdiL (CAAX protease family)
MNENFSNAMADGSSKKAEEMSAKAAVALTVKAWPVIFIVTIALSFATQAVAKLFGIDLPEQTNIELVRRYAGWNATFSLLVLQIVVLLPAIEEILFRGGLFRLPLSARRCQRAFPLVLAAAVVSSAVFSFAHYIDYAAWVKGVGFSLRALDNAFLALFIFGFAQCWLYRRTRRLFCAILNHALFNLTNLILLFIVPAPA